MYEKLGEQSLDLIFLKGYQWPFDTCKLDGSSQVDLLVAEEIKQGRSVYLDFTQNPLGLDAKFHALGKEGREYLERSGALFGTPIERLKHMNIGAYELYLNHGIDLLREPLKIAVCAQHCNGGIEVDANWQTTIPGVYAIGEAAGNFGVYRPGGSALNATQVGALRVAEHITAQSHRTAPENIPEYTVPSFSYGESNVQKLYAQYRKEMSRIADFARDPSAMKQLYEKAKELYDHAKTDIVLGNTDELLPAMKLMDLLLTQQAVFSSMLFSAEAVGTHGSAYIIGNQNNSIHQIRQTYTRTQNGTSEFCAVRPIPSGDLWFESLLRRSLKKL